MHLPIFNSSIAHCTSFNVNSALIFRVGQYVPLENAPGRGTLDCQTCPAGTKSDKSAEHRACFCLTGFARINRFGPCAKYTTQGISCEKDYRILKPGFWWSWEYNTTSKAKYEAFIENFELLTTVFPEEHILSIATYHNLSNAQTKMPTWALCMAHVTKITQDIYATYGRKEY